MSIVQQVESAKYSDMPSSAISTGLADFVLPPAEMPQRLIAYVKGFYLNLPPAEEKAAEVEPPLTKIFVLIRARTGHDFSGYKTSTIRRRIGRRMNLHQIKSPNAYLRYLEENPHEGDTDARHRVPGCRIFRTGLDFSTETSLAAPVGLTAFASALLITTECSSWARTSPEKHAAS